MRGRELQNDVDPVEATVSAVANRHQTAASQTNLETVSSLEGDSEQCWGLRDDAERQDGNLRIGHAELRQNRKLRNRSHRLISLVEDVRDLDKTVICVQVRLQLILQQRVRIYRQTSADERHQELLCFIAPVDVDADVLCVSVDHEQVRVAVGLDADDVLEIVPVCVVSFREVVHEGIEENNLRPVVENEVDGLRDRVRREHLVVEVDSASISLLL